MKPLDYEIDSFKQDNKSKIQKFWRFRRLEMILNEIKALNLPKNAEILDAGCGPGIIAEEIAKLGFKVTGLDNDKECINYANKNKSSNTTFTVHDLETPLPDKEYDAIMSSEVIEHLKSKNTLKNLSDKLKPNGFLVLTTPNYWGLWNIIEKAWSMKADYDWCHTHFTKFRAGNLKKQLNNVGMKTVKQYTPFYLSPFIPKISERAANAIYKAEIKLLSKHARFGCLVVNVSQKVQ